MRYGQVAPAKDLESIRRQCALRLQRNLLDPRVRAEKADEVPAIGSACRAASAPCGNRHNPLVPPLQLDWLRDSGEGLARRAASCSSSNGSATRSRPATVPSAPVFATAARSRSSPSLAAGQTVSVQPGSGRGKSTSASRGMLLDNRLERASGSSAASVSSGSAVASTAPAVRRRSPVKREYPDLPRIRPTPAPNGGIMAPTASSLRRGPSGTGSTRQRSAANAEAARGSATTKRSLSPRQRATSPIQRIDGNMRQALGGNGGAISEVVARSLSPSFSKAAEEPADRGFAAASDEPRKLNGVAAKRASPAKVRNAAEFNSCADSLQEAASALRRIIPAQKGAVPAVGSHQFFPPSRPSETAGAATNFQLSPCGGKHAAVGDQSFGLDVSTQSDALQQLVEENAKLREAFHEATQRLSKLEDERTRFMDENVYDIVNSVCGNPVSQPGMLPWHAQALTLPVTSSPHTPLATSNVHRSEEEIRSSLLSAQNDELRRELAQAGEVGEALEQQEQAAEDRIHALEQEQAFLHQQLARCKIDDAHVNTYSNNSIVSVGCTGGSGAVIAGSKVPFLVPTTATANEDTTALVHHLGAVVQCDHGDVENTALAEQLRISEARQAELLEENTRLQALSEASSNHVQVQVTTSNDAPTGNECEDVDEGEGEDEDEGEGEEEEDEPLESTEYLHPLDIPDSF